jgi:hypothetical protein
MKPFLLSILLFVCMTLTGSSQTIPPATADKAVVYFVRPTSLGFAINFSYFDSTQLIGRFNGPKYIRYECKPGRHLFWARSENRDFIEADLEAGKIYFIEAQVKMGAVKAAVKLKPLDPNDPEQMKKVLKLLGKKDPETFSQAELAGAETDLADAVARGMEKYQEEKSSGEPIDQLPSSLYYKPL